MSEIKPCEHANIDCTVTTASSDDNLVGLFLRLKCEDCGEPLVCPSLPTMAFPDTEIRMLLCLPSEVDDPRFLKLWPVPPAHLRAALVAEFRRSMGGADQRRKEGVN